MITVLQLLGIMVLTVFLALACFLMGAFVMFKGRKVPGEGFFKEPKGAVFSIPDADEAELTPEESEKRVLKNTERFLKSLGGG